MIETLTQTKPPMALEELVPAIRKFPTLSLQDKQSFIDHLISKHAIINFDWGRDWRYRRARVLGIDEVPSHVDEIIWRKDVPARLGRANPAGFQVIYLADRVDTAFAETRVDDASAIIAEFQFLPGRSIRLAPIGELTRIQRTGRGYLAGDHSTTLNNVINACPHNEAKALLITDDFLLGCLTNRDDDYDLSSSVVISILKRFPMISGVSYPSVRQLGAINFAIRTENFWDNWGISSIRRGRATHLAQGYYRFSGIRHVKGITNSGRLIWNDHTSEENSALILDPLWTPQTADKNHPKRIG